MICEDKLRVPTTVTRKYYERWIGDYAHWKINDDTDKAGMAAADFVQMTLCANCGKYAMHELLSSCRKMKRNEVINMAKRKLTVVRVKEFAYAHYNDGGKILLDCWTDMEIQAYIDKGGTLKGLAEMFSVWMEEP